jgi:hypothetical protein
MSLKSLTLLVAAATLAVCSGAAQAALAPVELAVNGGFETGDFTGWTQFGTSGGDQVIVSDASSGSFAAKITNITTFSNSLFKQANVNLTGGLIAGETVTIKFDAKGTMGVPGGVSFAEFFSEKAGGGTNSAVILGGAPLFAVSPNLVANEYRTFTFTTTVASLLQGGAPGGVTLQLGATNGDGAGTTMYYDNVSITVMREMPPIPEPSTYALMLAGLAGVGVLAKRRRQA